MREEFQQALCGRGRTGLVPWGPARRQEQGSRRWAGLVAAVGLTAECLQAWKMAEGPRRAQSHSQQQGVHSQLLLLYAGASEWRCGPKTASPSGAPESHRGRGGRGRADSLDRVGPCVELLEGVGWATVVAAAGASAEPVLTSMGTAKTEAKALSAAGKARPRPGQRSTLATEAETRPTKLPEGAERSPILIRGPCVRNRKNRRR